MSTSCQRDDLEQLRATFPDWTFEARWTTVASGPDRRALLARKGDERLSAWHADDLVGKIAAAVHAAALRQIEGDES
jgi:hypothetical protein